MTLMPKAPNQFETERLLSAALERGDQTALASLMEVSPSEICQQFTPSNPKQSVYYRFKRQMWALYGINARAARIINADFQASVESWEKPDDGKPESLALLVVAADREGDDVIQSWAEGKPLHEQIQQATEAIAALMKFRDAASKAAKLRGVDRA